MTVTLADGNVSVIILNELNFKIVVQPILHIVLWTEATINEMISSNQIRSTMPDPENEPELYAKVRAHQIHTCRSHLCGALLRW